MHLNPRLRTAGILAAALTMGGVGLASADVPDSTTGEISACVNTTNQAARIVDTEAGATCKSSESLLTWNQTGPQGPQGEVGETGPQGPQGEPGPGVLATGLVSAEGVLSDGVAQGPRPTVQREGPGYYKVVLNDLGQGCPLPQVTPFGPAVNMSVASLSCSGGDVTFHVWVEGGQDTAFFYMMLGL